jgi:putative Ca2+/H+ antiporter (TMEM165/GDT1 family)
MDFLIAALTAFALVVPIELPDKTFVATLVLATRYRPWSVWIGVVAAFGVQSLVAVTAGGLIALLPPRPVHYVAAVLFAVGAFVLIRSARRSSPKRMAEEEKEYSRKVKATRRRGRNEIVASFLVLFASEWGDLSQLLTAGLAARGDHPAAVFIGSWAGLALVSGAAVMLGKVLMRYVSLVVVQYVGAGVCAVLALVTLLTASR